MEQRHHASAAGQATPASEKGCVDANDAAPELSTHDTDDSRAARHPGQVEKRLFTPRAAAAPSSAPASGRLALAAQTSPIPEPPYPANTRAKGWRFELDYERIDQSDTWGLAAAMAMEGLPLARPLLLAIWYASWRQTPCGSLPSDDRLVAAAVGIPMAVLGDYREVLMRGWWLADDGRLYHDTLVRLVMEMVEYRSKNATRVADFKAAKREQRAGNALPTREQRAGNALPTREQRGGNALPTREQRGGTDTGTGTGSGTDQENSSSPSSKKKRGRAAPMSKPDDVTETTWQDWCAIRKAKKSPPSQTAVAQVRAEAEKAGIGLEQALSTCCARGWAGFEAGWLRSDVPGRAPTFQTATQRDAADAAERYRQMSGAPINGRGHAVHDIIDMEEGDVPRLQSN